MYLWYSTATVKVARKMASTAGESKFDIWRTALCLLCLYGVFVFFPYRANRSWPMAPKRFTFFQNAGEKAFAIDFGQYWYANSEYKCYQSCKPAVFEYFAIFLYFQAKMTRLKFVIFLGGSSKLKRAILRDRALRTEQKNVLHQSHNSPRSKVMAGFVVKFQYKLA